MRKRGTLKILKKVGYREIEMLKVVLCLVSKAAIAADNK
jgi:hypothetical protein